ncbi:MAG: hypothetical protein ACRDDZ_06765 [Marinifilaceae bacterium]
MRRIGAHYIFLPGCQFQKGGYAEFSNNKITMCQHAITDKEIAGLEFYGGLLITAEAARYLAQQAHPCDIKQVLSRFYSQCHDISGFATIGGIDFVSLSSTPTMVINYFR